MKPKEQWRQFYQHKYTSGKTFPSLNGLYMVSSDACGINEKPPTTKDGGIDWFGCVWAKDTSIKVNIPDPRVEFLLKDVADWREVVQWPDLEKYDFETAVKNSGIEDVDRDEKFIYYTMVMGPFERLHALMGFEEALMALLTDPEECSAFFTAFMDWRCNLIEKIKQYFNPDVIMYHDDIGTQKDMFFKPELWRELMKPHLKRATDKLHELGIFMEYHSCGKLGQVFPDLVEIGVDAWQGQEINDIPAFKERTKGKLEYHTQLDYQKMIAAYYAGTVTLDDVRAFTRESIEKNRIGGHYAPLMQPFGDVVSKTMTEEFASYYTKFAGDPD